MRTPSISPLESSRRPCLQIYGRRGTPRYGTDLMLIIFILCLEDTYTNEQLFQLKPEEGKKIVSFEKLVDAVSEISANNDNVAEVLNMYVEVASPDSMTKYFCILTNQHCYD